MSSLTKCQAERIAALGIDPKKLYTLREINASAGYSINTLRRWIYEGIGGRSQLITLEAPTRQGRPGGNKIRILGEHLIKFLVAAGKV